MHRTCRLICQKSEGIPFVTSRSIQTEVTAKTSVGGISGYALFILTNKNSVVVSPCTLKQDTLSNALLNDLQVNSTPKQIMNNLLIVGISFW